VKIEVSVDIEAPPDTVWRILSDLERWPTWTPTVKEVRRLNGPSFAVGSILRIRQPKLKTLDWHVSEFQEGRLFTWKARSTGISVVARHVIRPSGRGSTVVLAVDQQGWLDPVVNLFFGALSRRYVELEAQSLKRRCEELASRSGVSYDA
jgi:uncharacterized membrane protein